MQSAERIGVIKMIIGKRLNREKRRIDGSSFCGRKLSFDLLNWPIASYYEDGTMRLWESWEDQLRLYRE